MNNNNTWKEIRKFVAGKTLKTFYKINSTLPFMSWLVASN